MTIKTNINSSNTLKKLHNPKAYTAAVYIPCWLIQIPIALLSHGAKILYGRLAQWSNENGIVYRSSTNLSQEIGASVRTIGDLLKELKEVGLIGTYQKEKGGMNHFEFYDHPWMHDPINEQLSYRSDTHAESRIPPMQDPAYPPCRILHTPMQDPAIKNINNIKINKNNINTHTFISDEKPDFDNDESGFDDYLSTGNPSRAQCTEESNFGKNSYLSTAGDPPSHFDENDKSVIIKTIAFKKETLTQESDHSVSSDKHNYEHNCINEKTDNKPGREGGRFEDFWKVYPVKQAKHPSRKKWIREGLDKMADEIIAKVQQQSLNDRKWLNGFIPNPLTYINQKRWEDELDISRSQTHLSGKQQSTNSFHETMAKYSNLPKKGYYDESGNFTECYL